MQRILNLHPFVLPTLSPRRRLDVADIFKIVMCPALARPVTDHVPIWQKCDRPVWPKFVFQNVQPFSTPFFRYYQQRLSASSCFGLNKDRHLNRFENPRPKSNNDVKLTYVPWKPQWRPNTHSFDLRRCWNWSQNYRRWERRASLWYRVWPKEERSILLDRAEAGKVRRRKV